MATDAMRYEDIKLARPGKSAVKREIERDIRNMHSTSIVWFLVKKHKFGLLMTFTAVYMAFTMFGTLIVGLLQSY